MMPMIIRAMAATLLTLPALSGCTAATGETGSPRSAPPLMVALENATAVELARADSARYPYTEADIQFMTNMIGHHAQALVMAAMAPSHGASPQIALLAARITNSQEDEIGIMQRWLADRLQPVPQVSETGMMEMHANGDHSMHHAGGMMMPGMLTPEELRTLDQARGREFDRLFLSYMIQHHQGAVAMVEELFSTHGAAQDQVVFKFASDVNVDQQTEIARMQKMLVDVIFTSGPPD